MNPVIIRPEALEESFVPEQILHRKGQLEETKEALAPLAQRKTHKNVLYYGPSGTGKTTSARFLLRQFCSYADVEGAYVKCWHRSNAEILFRIDKTLGALTDKLKKKGVGEDELFSILAARAERTPICLILDEFDKMKDLDLIYDLSEIRIGLILISSEERAFWSLAERIRSRLTPLIKIHFPRYRDEELLDILKARALIALRPGSVNHEVLSQIVDSAHGNAHLALKALRLAAEYADKEGFDKIEEDHVQKAISGDEIDEKALSQLDAHSQLIYTIIKEHGVIDPAGLNKEYRKRSANPLSERSVRDRIHKLEARELIQVVGESNARKYVVRKI
jgi:cell division control protein 6